MPCSNCSNCGHNVRTCPIRVKPTKRETELTKLQKKFKKERKKSIKRLREIKTLTDQLERVYEENGEQLTMISKKQKQIEDKDDTIQKLKKDENDICNICFDSIAPGSENKTECGHSFHCGCLLKWLKKNNSCPCCRVELYEKKNKIDDLEKIMGDALVGMYGYSIIRDPEMVPLIEFGNNIINGLFPEENWILPNVEDTESYIIDCYTDDDVVDSSDDEDEVWEELIGSEHDVQHFAVNSITGEIREFPLVAPGVGGVIENSTGINV